MKHIGIICELNPIHKGHAYLISRAREEGVVVCLMSGNFTQRATAAILPPVARAAMAVAAGADLVLELPFPFSCASASFFAGAGVDILIRLGVDTLAFGSESGDLAHLQSLCEKPEPKTPARGCSGTAEAYFSELGEVLPPNDILALSYLRAAAGKMNILPVRRKGSGYHGTQLPEEGFASATAIRRALLAGEDVSDFLPDGLWDMLLQAAKETGFADTAALGPAALACLRAQAWEGRRLPAECGGGLLAHLHRAALRSFDYHSLCRNAATKRYTNARVRRSLLYLLSGVTEEDLRAAPAYVRLLAAGPRGVAFLRESSQRRQIPVVTKPRDVSALGESAVRARTLSAIADGLFSLCFEKGLLPHELQTARPFIAKKQEKD